MDWRDPNSIPEKRRLIEEHYGDTVPGYLLFHLGGIDGLLTDEEERILNDLFFDGVAPGFGAKEMHDSNGQTGSYLQRAPNHQALAPFIVLRIRGARKMHYSFTLRGEERPLLQASAGDGSKPIINFMERWGSTPKDIFPSRDSEAPRPLAPAGPSAGSTTVYPREIVFVLSPPAEPSARREPFEALSAAAMTAPPPRTRLDRFLGWLFD